MQTTCGTRHTPPAVADDFIINYYKYQHPLRLQDYTYMLGFISPDSRLLFCSLFLFVLYVPGGVFRWWHISVSYSRTPGSRYQSQKTQQQHDVVPVWAFRQSRYYYPLISCINNMYSCFFFQNLCHGWGLMVLLQCFVYNYESTLVCSRLLNSSQSSRLSSLRCIM